MNTQLAIHEWTAVGTIIALLILLTTIAWMDDEPAASPQSHLDPNNHKIAIAITGAVEEPGEYHLPVTAKVADVLALAKPLPSADLRRLNLQSKLKEGRTLVIREMPMVTVHIYGAVSQEGPITVSKGTTRQALLSLLSVTSDADTSSLNTTRRLRDNETIHIPRLKHP